MKIEKYKLRSENNFTFFEFISEGPKGSIRKIVLFQEADEPNFFNLAFGDKMPDTGDIDDLIVSGNGDTEKVLATVVAALYAFFDKHPNAFVYAIGSTPARTRLYRIGITRYYNEMIIDFELYGQIGDSFYELETGVNYNGFLVERKF